MAELQGLVFEEGEFYLVKLPHSTAVIKLLQRIRDEAHRFAVGYHTKLKVEAQTISALDQIKGIGPATRQKLLAKYKSLAGVKRAGFDSVKELIGEAKARLVWRALD